MSVKWLLGKRIPPPDEAARNLRASLPPDGTMIDFTPWLAMNLGVMHANGIWLNVGAPSPDTPRSVRRAYRQAFNHAWWYRGEMERLDI